MSLYEMLPQKVPRPESLPDSGGGQTADYWSDPFSVLAEEVPDFDPAADALSAGPLHAGAGEAGAPGGGIPPDIRDESGLQAYIRQAFAAKLPQITEFREKGFNLSGPDTGAMAHLQAALDAVKPHGAGGLAEAGRGFLAVLHTLPEHDPAMPPVLQETVLQAGRLVRLLTTALEALQAGAQVRGLDWAAEAKGTARAQREKLVAATLAASPQTGLSPQAQQAQRLQAEGLMFSPTYQLSAEYKKFSQLQDSLLAESRLVRHRLTGYLAERTVRVEEGARDIREFALNTLLAQSAAKPGGTPEQLAAWGARLQEYTRHLPGRDTDFDPRLLAGNPLAAALAGVLKQAAAGAPVQARLARAMLPVTTALGQATTLLAQVQQRVALPEEESRKLSVKTAVPLPAKIRAAGRGVLDSTATLARKTGHRVSRGASRSGHLLRQALWRGTDPDGLDRAVRNTGLLLLDEIQQAQRQITQLATQAWLLQEAQEQQWRVQATPASLDPELPVLAGLLDEQLAQEAVRWQLTGQQALARLEGLLAPFIRLTATGFYSELGEELQQAKALGEQQRWGDISRMADMMSGVADELAGVARGLDSAVIRLSGHGHAGGRELGQYLRGQTRKLEQLKARVKTRVTRITGTSLDNFSRGGMLARGVAEWAQALKQAYLEGVPPEQRAPAAAQFDRALAAVMAENRAHFAAGGDPQAEGFLKRLSLALAHAATGTQVYPPTAEEILAGSRSVPEDIRRWAERKMLSGALWGAIRGGFNLVTGPVSLPLRVVIRGARTGYALAGGLRKMNRVRLGEGPATGVKRAFIGQELAKVGIRLALSLSPAVGWGVAVTLTAREAGKHRHDRGALKKMVKRFALQIPEEGLWAGGYAGVRTAVSEAVQAWAAHKLQQQVDELLAGILSQQEQEAYGMPDRDAAGSADLMDQAEEEDAEEEEEEQDVEGEEEEEEEEEDMSAGPAIRSDETGEVPGETAVTEPLPGIQQRPRVQLTRPGVKAFAGGMAKGVSPAPGRQATPAETADIAPGEESETEAEDVPRRRGKRAAELPAKAHYPAPKRETAIDPQLELRVRNTFPIANGIPLTASKAPLNTEQNNFLKYYTYNQENFLFIDGRYRQLHGIKKITVDNSSYYEAMITPYWDVPDDKKNPPLKIKFVSGNDQWQLADDAEGKKSTPAESEKYTITRSSTALSEAAKKWQANKAYKYDKMEPGKEGQVYYDYDSKYIYLNNNYWPIILLSETKVVVSGVDNGRDVSIDLQGNEWCIVAAENTQEITPRDVNVNKDLLPSLPMKTSVSAVLDEKVSTLFPRAGSYKDNISNLISLMPTYNIYHAINDSYLYVGGGYFCIAALSFGTGGDINGTLYSSSDIKSPGTKSLSITFKNSDQQWHLNEDIEDAEDAGHVSENEKTIFTALSPSVKTGLSSIKAGSGFTYDNMIAGVDGAIYSSGDEHYIYLMSKYWPVRIYDNNQIDVTIKAEGEKSDIIIRLYLDNSTLKFSSSNRSNNTLIQASVSSGVSSELKSADISSLFYHPDINAGVEGFVYSYGNDNYIYINGYLYNFQWISENFAAINFTVSGTETLVFVKKEQQQWIFLEKSSSGTYASFDDVLRRLKAIDVDPDIHAKLHPVLSENMYTSWGDILNKLRNIVDEEIFKRYTNPNDNYLKNLLIIKSNVLSWINSDEDQKSSALPERNWNEPLISLYKTALSQGTPTPYILTLAQNAKVLINNLERKRDLLKTDDLDNRIKSQENRIASYNKEISSKTTILNHGERRYAQRKRLEDEIADYEKMIDGAQKQINVLQQLKSAILKKRKEYSDEIKTLNETYDVAFAGILSGKEILKRNLAEQGHNKKELVATQNAIIELALKEVAITSKARTAYTSAELNELKKINIAKTMLIVKQVNASTFSEIIAKLKDSDIDKPGIKNSYADIIWADEQGTKIAKKLFGDDVGEEVENMVTAICYWLLKHNKKTSDLNGKDFEKIVDEYSNDVHKFNPLTQEKNIPEGYTPLSGMIKSEYFQSQYEFNKQFSDYKEKFINYDASERTKEILLVSGLSVEEVLQNVNKRIRLQVQLFDDFGNPEIGELLFLQLPDGRWVFFSIFSGSVKCKVFSNAEMLKNDYLRAITMLKSTGGGDEIREVYDSSFFENKYNINVKRPNDYKSSNVRWDDVNAGLMYGALYTEELINGDPVPSFIKNKQVYTVSYNTRDNTAISGTVISVLNTSVHSVLHQSADALKSDLYTPSLLQKIAFALVPFYKEIYHSATDKYYQPDVGSIMLDIVGVVSVASQAGVRVATILKNTPTLGRILQQGVKSGLSGQALKLYAIKELAKESAFSALKILKTSTLATLDLVDPGVIRGISKLATNKISKAGDFRKLFSTAPSSEIGRTINKKHARTDISIESMQTQTVRDATVYSAPDAGGKGPYYIKVEDNVYEVRWDEAFRTWRTVDPNDPGKLSYGDALEFSNGVWNIKNASETDKYMFARLTPKEPLRDAARRSQLSQESPGTSWDYAVDLLENSKMLSGEKATELRQGIKLASKYQSGAPDSPGGVNSLFNSTKVINNEEALLRVKPGEVIIFMATDPNAPTKGARPIHTMVSIGNGRFAGRGNSILHTSLSDEKKILTAEQLGEFKDNAFRLRGDNQTLTDLHIIAGEPKGIQRPESLSLRSIAEQLPPTLPDDVDLAEKTTGLLKQAGELTHEQATALQVKLTAMLKASKGGTAIAGTTESLFISATKVTDRASLQAIEKGKLVVFGNTSSPSFAVHHVMYSLGDGDFMMVNPHLLDKRLVSKNGIINASLFPDDLFTRYGVLSGDISLSRLRMASLLGRDATFFVDGPILTVRLHGAPGIANFMDASELAEVIKGLGLRETPPLKLGQIREIKLESCFGAFGFLPTGKALAHILGKKVTAYPFRFSQATRDTRNIMTRAKVYMPSDVASADVIKNMEKQQSRNHDFWNRLLGMYVAVKGKRTRREANAFNDLLSNVSELATGKIDAATFLENMPEYKQGFTAEIKDLNELSLSEVTTADAFAGRCMDIINMSTYSANLLDKYLGGEGN